VKKATISVILTLFVLLISLAHPVSALPGQIWVGSANITSGIWEKNSAAKPAQLNAAIAKFEGLLNAYAKVSGDIKGECKTSTIEIEERVLTASDKLSSSLEEFNTALAEIYPNMSEEEQLVVQEVYSSLTSYLDDLAKKANLIFSNSASESPNDIIFSLEDDAEPQPWGNPGVLWSCSKGTAK